ncbi:hypothetical protein ACLOJK_019604 [Asimina triloba]
MGGPTGPIQAAAAARRSPSPPTPPSPDGSDEEPDYYPGVGNKKNSVMMKPLANLQVWVVRPAWPELGPPGPLELSFCSLWEEASWLTHGWGSVLPVGAKAACFMWELRRTLMARPATGTNLLLPMLAEGDGAMKLLARLARPCPRPASPAARDARLPEPTNHRQPSPATARPAAAGPPVQPLPARSSSRCQPDPVQPARVHHLPRVRPSDSFRPPPVLRPFAASSYRSETKGVKALQPGRHAAVRPSSRRRSPSLSSRVAINDVGVATIYIGMDIGDDEVARKNHAFMMYASGLAIGLVGGGGFVVDDGDVTSDGDEDHRIGASSSSSSIRGGPIIGSDLGRKRARRQPWLPSQMEMVEHR